MVKYLIEKGSDLQTALQNAIQKDHVLIVLYLLLIGANFNNFDQVIGRFIAMRRMCVGKGDFSCHVKIHSEKNSMFL